MRRRNQTADGASIAAGVNRAADINPGTAMEAMGVAMKTVMVMEAMMMATAGGRGAGDERSSAQRCSGYKNQREFLQHCLLLSLCDA